MNRGTYVASAGAIVALAVAAVALAASLHEPATGSALSRASNGWMAARRYLEARGCSVTLVDSAAFEGRGVLVAVFPWQRPHARGAGDMASRHLARGGTVIFAYSGRPSWAEPVVASALGMGHEASADAPPLHPLRWREWEAATSDLVPDRAGFAPLRVATPRARPTPPSGATVLFRDAGGRPLVFAFRRFAGRVFVVPASAFDNAGIEEAGNAGLLESLAATLGTEWAFDEYHHGLLAAATGGEEGAGVGRAVDAFLFQLALVYALALLAVSRRFGPPWNEPPVFAGSTGSFLRGVGALHHRLGHHAVAAGLLVARARQLHPRLRIPDVAPWDRDAEGFLRLAREIGGARPGEEKR